MGITATCGTGYLYVTKRCGEQFITAGTIAVVHPTTSVEIFRLVRAISMAHILRPMRSETAAGDRRIPGALAQFRCTSHRWCVLECMGYLKVKVK